VSVGEDETSSEIRGDSGKEGRPLWDLKKVNRKGKGEKGRPQCGITRKIPRGEKGGMKKEFAIFFRVRERAWGPEGEEDVLERLAFERRRKLCVVQEEGGLGVEALFLRGGAGEWHP